MIFRGYSLFRKLMKSKECIVLSGSYARGKQTIHSDMDLISISDNVALFHTESIYTDGAEAQVIFMPMTKIHKIMLEQSNEFSGIVASMLKSCIILSRNCNYADKLTKFVDKQPEISPGGEQALLSYVSSLRNRCDDLRHAETELEKTLLVSTIYVLLAHILAKNFITGAKHSIRVIQRGPYHDEFLAVTEEFRKSKDPNVVLNYAEKILRSFRKDIATSGAALNNIRDDNFFIVFFPKGSIFNNEVWTLVNEILAHFKDCDYHVFRQNKWQALSEGVYICVKGRQSRAIDLIKRLNDDPEFSKKRLSLGVDICYPYNTTFAEGVFFGGKKVFESLIPAFSSIWAAYYAIVLKYGQKSINKFAFLSGMVLTQKLVEEYEKHIKDKEGFFSKLAWLLLPDAVNPDGLFNYEQTRNLKETAVEIFSDQYENNKDSYKSALKDISSHAIQDMEEMLLALKKLIDAVSTVSSEELFYPDVYPFDNVLDIFYSEVFLHSMAILQLSNEEKFSIVFTSARINGICIEDSL